MSFETPPVDELKKTLDDPTAPIGARMRSTYYLKHTYSTDKECDKDLILKVMESNLPNQAHGGLMQHELAYCLGQMGSTSSLPVLGEVLCDPKQDVMTRHECAEALASVGHQKAIPFLQQCMASDENVPPEIAETVEIALDFLDWKLNSETADDETTAPRACACMLNSFNSHDPAPPHPDHAEMSEQEVGAILADETRPLFERYRAMFSLRNKATEAAVLQLGHGLVADRTSALLRHEICFVLGQLARVSSVPFLAEILRRGTKEHAMARHEAAEALGAIEESWSTCKKILREFLNDEDQSVRESCLVALDAAQYYGYEGEEGEEGEDDAKHDESDVQSMQPSFAAAKALATRAAAADPANVSKGHFNVADAQKA